MIEYASEQQRQEAIYNNAGLCPRCGQEPVNQVTATLWQGHCGGWSGPDIQDCYTCCGVVFVELGISDPHSVAIHVPKGSMPT